jgi:hypothetical protein
VDHQTSFRYEQLERTGGVLEYTMRITKLAIPWLSYPRKDAEGPYTKVCKVERPGIDTTPLRVNQDFFNTGNSKLYSKNTFEFEMVKNHKYSSCPSTYDGIHVHQLAPKKHILAETDLGYDEPFFSKAISSIRNQIRENRLLGWVYYDPFLRFLDNIDPRNAADIKTLKFYGIAMIHQCFGDECWKECQDLVNSLCIYMPFIKAFCHNLRKYIIRVGNDWRTNNQSQANTNEQPTNSEGAMLPFLESELRTSIDELLVFEDRQDGEYNYDPLYWAIETAQWIVKQAAERYKSECIEEEKRMEAAASIRCDFCGGTHVWAECYYFCPLCGAFGHLRKTCSRLEEFGGPEF